MKYVSKKYEEEVSKKYMKKK